MISVYYKNENGNLESFDINVKSAEYYKEWFNSKQRNEDEFFKLDTGKIVNF